VSEGKLINRLKSTGTTLLIYKLVSHLISHVGIRSKTVHINLSEYTKNINYRIAVSGQVTKSTKK